jgi:23S rRNA (uracil1939-C5)-methyltransferase
MNSKTEIVTLEKFANGGECFGRLTDNRAVFVPFTLPGETVRLELMEEKKSFARGKVIEFIATAPERISPKCAHFSICGGCAYQHFPYNNQLSAKTEILREQLYRIGKLENPPIHPTIPAPTEWDYRDQMRFYFMESGTFGFHALRSQQIVPITECHQITATIRAFWPLLDLGTIPGLDSLSLRVGAAEEVMLILESSDPHPFDLAVDLPISVIHAGPGGSLVLAGDDHLVVELAGRKFQISADSYFPPNLAMTEIIIQHILEQLDIPANAIVIDAFCGAGLRSAFLAPKAGRLIGIDSSPSECEDFAVNLDEFENVELYEDTVKNVLPTLGLKPDILMVAPPKSGLGHQVLDLVLANAPGQIVYHSIDPATLSRDARRLIEGGFQLKQITPFDTRPHTQFIESLSIWIKS